MLVSDRPVGVINYDPKVCFDAEGNTLKLSLLPQGLIGIPLLPSSSTLILKLLQCFAQIAMVVGTLFFFRYSLHAFPHFVDAGVCH